MNEYRIVEYDKEYFDHTIWAPGSLINETGTKVPVTINFDPRLVIGVAELSTDDKGVNAAVTLGDEYTWDHPIFKRRDRGFAPGFVIDESTSEDETKRRSIRKADILEVSLASLPPEDESA